MHTRFHASKKTHTMNQGGPMVHIPSDAPGAAFLGYLGSAFQKKIMVPQQSLLTHALLLNAFLRENLDILPYRYSVEAQMCGRADMVTKGSGCTSGFRIDGHPHSIRGGNGECYLTKFAIDANGRGHVAERIDVRRLKRITTDDWGEIKIRRKKIPFTLPERLTACVGFLESVSDEQIVVYSYDQPPSLHQVLRYFAEGGGGDDWAIETVGESGPDGKSQLLDALTDQAFQKHRAAIIQLLLLCHPGDDTSEAIERFIEREPPETQRDYRLLFSAFTDAMRRGS